jgi:hypothetical protein
VLFIEGVLLAKSLFIHRRIIRLVSERLAHLSNTPNALQRKPGLNDIAPV